MNYDNYSKIVHELYGNVKDYRVEWTIGGTSGGNCWGDEAHPFHTDDPEPELDLDKLFEVICPNMTFLQYRKVIASVLKRSTETYEEYYGNSTVNGAKEVNFSELYNALVKFGVIQT